MSYQVIKADAVRNDAISHQVSCYEGTPGSGVAKWEVMFQSADGTIQKFDGVKWTEKKPAVPFNLFTNPR